MTSDRASGDPTRPDAEDWWQGTADAGTPSSADPTAPSDHAADAAAAAGPHPRSRWLLGAAAGVIVVAGIAVAMLATRGGDDGDDPGAASAATGGPSGAPGPGGFAGGGGGTAGTITEVDTGAATLVVETVEGDAVEVRAGDDTTISETVEGSTDDLAVGDDVLVVGESADGAVAADQIVAGGGGGFPGGGGGFPGGGGGGSGGDRPEPPEGFDPPADGGEPPEGFDPPAGGGGGLGGGALTSGTIESIDDGSLTVRSADDDETVTVTLSSDTAVLVSKELSFDDLTEDDEVTVTGETEDGVLDAVVIRRGDAGFGFGGGRPPAGDDDDEATT